MRDLVEVSCWLNKFTEKDLLLIKNVLYKNSRSIEMHRK